MEDFRLIVDLINDPYIFDKYSTINIGFTAWVYNDILEYEGGLLYDIPTLREKIRCQVETLDDTLDRLDKEMPSD